MWFMIQGLFVITVKARVIWCNLNILITKGHARKRNELIYKQEAPRERKPALRLKILWKSTYPYFHNVAKRLDAEYRKKYCIQGVKSHIPKNDTDSSFCVIFYISWKRHENPFILFFRNVAKSQTGGQTDWQTNLHPNRDENITFSVLWRL